MCDPTELTTLTMTLRELGHRFQVRLEREALNREEANARYHQNSLASIHRLPHDVLRYIISLSLDPVDMADIESVPRYCHQRKRLAMVSAGWSYLIKSSPEFWTTFSSNTSLSNISRYLPRSGVLPLDIQAIAMRWDYAEEEFWNIFTPEISRWRRINAKVSPILIQTIDHRACHLEELDLIGPSASVLAQGQDLYLPQLQVLKLRHIDMPWTDPVFSNLSVIRFYDVALDIRLLFKILKRCSLLTELVFADTSNIDLTHYDINVSRPKISLPRLKVLTLTNLPPGVLDQIVKRLAPGPLSTLEIDANRTLRSSIRLFQSPPPYFRDTVLSMLGKGLLPDIVTSAYIIIKGNTDDGKLLLGGPSEDVVEWFLQVLDSSNSSRSLKISLGAPHSLRAASQRFDHLSYDIDLDFGSENVIPNLEAFCEAKDDGSWILPSVSNIRLYLDVAQDLLVARLLRQRYDASSLTPPTRITYQSKRPCPYFQTFLHHSIALRTCQVVHVREEGHDEDKWEMGTTFADNGAD